MSKTKKNLVDFIEEYKGNFSLIGILMGVIVYLSKFADELTDKINVFSNLGFGVILVFVLLVSLSFLIFIKSTREEKEYGLFTIIFCLILLIVTITTSFYVSSKFPDTWSNSISMVLFFGFLFLSLYLTQKHLKKLELAVKDKRKWPFIETFLLFLVFVGLELSNNFWTWWKNFGLTQILTDNILRGIYFGLRLFLVFASLFFIVFLVKTIIKIVIKIKDKIKKCKSNKQNSNKLK